MKENSLLAIIAAAGIGKRFDGDLPKQYVKINGRSIIENAVKPFIDSKYISKIVIAISDGDDLIKNQNFYNCEKIEYIIGGSTRQESIFNALNSIEDNYEFVITHDAARPNVSENDIARLFEDRGVRLDRTYQLNFGGNTDFLNMLERSRLTSKKISKTNAVQSQLEKELPTDDVHIGPSDHVPWLEDRKWAYIRIEGTSFGDLPLNVELKLEVEDSPNSAGVAIDAIRCAMIAKDRGESGSVDSASAYFMKSPNIQYTDEEARQMVEDFANNKNQSKSNKSRLDQ